MSTVLYPSAMLTQDIEDAYTCAQCDQPATSHCAMRCCPEDGLLCNQHLAQARKVYAELVRFYPYVLCTYCDRNLGRPRTYDDMVKVTPL